MEIHKNETWKEVTFEINNDEHEIECSVHYNMVDDSVYEISTRKLNSTLKQFQETYEESVKRVTEAKFKYQILKMLVQPFVKGELDDELKFKRGHIQTEITMKYKKKEYYVYAYNLLDPEPIEELLVYSESYDENIGIPIYEFVNDTDNSIKKMKTMADNITKCCLEYYEREQRINNRTISILNKLRTEKQNQIAKLRNWGEH